MLTRFPFEQAALSYALWLGYHATPGPAQIASCAGLRASSIGDSIYAEGGLTTNGTWDGNSWQTTGLTNSSHGILYRINLAHPFNASDAYQSLQPIIEYQDAETPNYLYGGMLVGKDGFVLFG